VIDGRSAKGPWPMDCDKANKKCDWSRNAVKMQTACDSKSDGGYEYIAQNNKSSDREMVFHREF
jgi:hypothetical protein